MIRQINWWRDGNHNVISKSGLIQLKANAVVFTTNGSQLTNFLEIPIWLTH